MSASADAAASADPAAIAAVATPPGRGGIGVVRVSGGNLQAIARGVLGKIPPPRHATLARFLDENGEAMDRGIALYFPAPNSFTGQNVLELHGHGGTGVMRRILSRCLALGARAAEPGEFALRAYLNGKMDLAQADAVADIVNAETDAAARAAARSLAGMFSREAEAVARALETARVGAEAMMDFADEDLDDDNFAEAALTEALARLESLLARAGQGALLAEGISAAIAGPPNVGKSSLLNRLAREEAAIVSPQPGTTRDAVAREITPGGLRIRLTDTAGIRGAEEVKGGGGGWVESEGIRRARALTAAADLILLVGDESRRPEMESEILTGLTGEKSGGTVGADGTVGTVAASGVVETGRTVGMGGGGGTVGKDGRGGRGGEGGRVILVRNKIDLDGLEAGVRGGVVYISAKTGAGLDELRGEILRKAGVCESEPPFSARARHLRALESALALARRARRDWAHTELAAESLRRARNELASLTGAFGDEELLGEIFSRFCVGK